MGQSFCCNNDPCTKNATLDSNIIIQSYTNDADLPHKCSEILKDACIDVHSYCKDKLSDMLYKGILISDGKTKVPTLTRQIFFFFFLKKI